MSHRVVYLHIGAPKTGTTYLQNRLALNAKSLASHGVHFPTGSPLMSPELFQFRAALDLLGQDWGGAPGHADGSWDTLVRRVKRRSGTVVISHEILAPATAAQVAKVTDDLGSGSEIHVVYSARDLARQLPAAWQESIKQGRRWSYRSFLDKVESGSAWSYHAYQIPDVLGTWGAGLPPDRVHVVTVPQDPDRKHGDLLWLRMCTAFGIDPEWAPIDSDRYNRSLGVAEVQVIRQLNRRMDRATRRDPAYDGLIRDMLAQRELVNRKSVPVRLPPERYDWVEEQTERWIEWIEGSGVDVVGDLEDLRPVRPAEDARWRDPDKVSPRRRLSAAIAALEAMTHEAAQRPDPKRQFTTRVRSHAQRLRER